MNGSHPEYRKGSIVRLTMKNFVTYSDAEIRPGPQLNVVLGPNGTGKSTLVCAMVLGLGGKPAVLGRAKEPRDFIKHGESTAIVECELYGGRGAEKNVVIRRKILSDNTSQWRINGKESNVKEVLARVHRMNVQVDNLCQFLPQDRVSSFAEMDPRELLKETELAINETLHAQHMDLIQLKKDEIETRVSVESKQKTLVELRLANEELRRDVNRFRERERLMIELELLESKRPWVAFEASRLHAVELQTAHKALLEQLKRAEVELAPLEAEAQAKKEATQSGAAEEEEAKRAVRTHVTTRAQVLEKLKTLAETTTRLERQLDQVEQEEERRSAERRRLTKLIDELRKQVEQAEKVEEQRLHDLEYWKAQIDTLKEQEKEAVKTHRQSQERFNSLEDKRTKLAQKSKDTGRLKHTLLQKLASADAGVAKFHSMMEANRQKFRGEVYGPMVLHIKCYNPQYAAWLDKILTYQHLTGFVFEKEEDRDMATRWCQDAKVPLPTFYYSPDALSNLKRPLKKSQMTPLGLDGYIDSTFEGPDLVCWTLCNVARIHTVPFALNDELAQQEEISKFARAAEPIRRFITPTNDIFFKPSNYSNNVAASVTPLKPGLKWIFPQERVDEEAIANELRAIEAEHKEALEVVAQTKAEITRLKPLIEEAVSNHSKARHSDTASLKLRLKSAETELKAINVDVEAERERIRAQIIASLQKRVPPALSLSEITPKLLEAEFISAELLLKRGFLKSLAERAIQAYNDARAQFAGLEDQVRNTERDFNEAKENTRALKAEAQKRSQRTPELEAQWATLPSTLEELDSQIENHRIRIASMSPNRDVIEKYEERERKIAELADELSNFDKTLARKQTKIQQLRNAWLPEVEEKVSAINENFREFFREIGCVGEVKLDTSTDDNFEKFGIDIWVSYRKTEEARKLDARVQSGGERSVATMLYLIALQQLSDCPFRLVDEINQGMDPQNERMIFDQVTSQASKANTPQYFLITPKLLPDLNFTEAITMLCVFNGPFMVDQKDWVVTAP